ncbi:MAG: hypothetical protein WD208_06570 [Dehalococcoidia bacterium]
MLIRIFAAVFLIIVAGTALGCGNSAAQSEPLVAEMEDTSPTPTPTSPAASSADSNLTEIDASGEGPNVTVAVSDAPTGRPRTHDDALAEAVQVDSGFGGYYLDPDDNGIAYVYLLNPEQRENVDQILSRLVEPDIDIREVRVLQGEFSMAQLVGWYPEMKEAIFPRSAIVKTSIDEGRNRLAVTVEDEATQEAVQAAIAKSNVPLEAVEVSVGSPITLTSYP